MKKHYRIKPEERKLLLKRWMERSPAFGKKYQFVRICYVLAGAILIGVPVAARLCLPEATWNGAGGLPGWMAFMASCLLAALPALVFFLIGNSRSQKLKVLYGLPFIVQREEQLIASDDTLLHLYTSDLGPHYYDNADTRYPTACYEIHWQAIRKSVYHSSLQVVSIYGPWQATIYEDYAAKQVNQKLSVSAFVEEQDEFHRILLAYEDADDLLQRLQAIAPLEGWSEEKKGGGDGKA